SAIRNFQPAICHPQRPRFPSNLCRSLRPGLIGTCRRPATSSNLLPMLPFVTDTVTDKNSKKPCKHWFVTVLPIQRGKYTPSPLSLSLGRRPGPSSKPLSPSPPTRAVYRVPEDR